MLYKLNEKDGSFSELSPMPFISFLGLGNQEKDLENLIASNLFDVLFEDDRLLPIFQEKQGQSVADIYALNQEGDLTIFELKRGAANEDAALQILRYAQEAGRWQYDKLQELYNKYKGGALDEAHKHNFGLPQPLLRENFNRKQHLVIVGNAADDVLADRVDYWKSEGVSMDFFPYRVYNIGDARFFEFFCAPYDRHSNPGSTKGVMFDTNKSYDENAIWYMMEKRRVAAFGSSRDAVDHLARNDVVFFYHPGVGLVAAGKVSSDRKVDDNMGASYFDVEFLTPIPHRKDSLKGIKSWEVHEIMGRRFFWAKTDKRPYLSPDDAEKLLEHLNEKLGADS